DGDAAGDAAQLLPPPHAGEARDAALDVLDGDAARAARRDRRDRVADVVAADQQRLEAFEPLAAAEHVERDAPALADLAVGGPPDDAVGCVGAIVEHAVRLDPAVRAL